ncbi:uncharacterized protein PHALS_01944 [Plasmopara halstedii]|uniref:Uncharacterized protein n=1 Tax=Plasmopara halstedii TaxID=4781 RepID=A0A0P1ATL6_PLAHL|nr:uncharacterized protein PHALS_01944 [Plasmopara halstedii]CEG45661.1 hypothetical protein PHALS_01944 [Plasmopara halstedii]|eukprot:XP_024582030.1 hypothetical protein PHALS_01944 [Plasmopara halstedii]
MVASVHMFVHKQIYLEQTSDEKLRLYLPLQITSTALSPSRERDFTLNPIANVKRAEQHSFFCEDKVLWCTKLQTTMGPGKVGTQFGARILIPLH